MKKTLLLVIFALSAAPLLRPPLSEAGGPRGHAGAIAGAAARHGYYGGHHGSRVGAPRAHSGVRVGVGVRHGYYGGYYGYRYPRYWGPRYWGTGAWVGSGFWWGWPYYGYPSYPYYYSAPPAVIQQPPVYLEQAPPQEPQYWYYCQNPQGYYPYIQSCPNGWMKVVPPDSPPER